MLKKWLSVILSLMFLCTTTVLAEGIDFTSLEGVIPYEEPISVTFARAMDSTVTIDESNPAIKSYTENRWFDTFKDVLNIDVSYKWLAADGDANKAKWGAAIASGDLPDAGLVSKSIYQELLQAGMIADMTDIYQNEGSSILKGLYSEDELASLCVEGRMYGLPSATTLYGGCPLLFVRTDWLEALNLEMPKTMDDVVAIARTFKENKMGGDDTIGLMFAAAGAVNDGVLAGFMNGYNAYKGIWVDVDGKLAWSDTLPEMREALLVLQALYAEGLINQDFAVTNGTVASEYVASGKCGIFYSADWTVVTSMNAAVELNPEADFACVGSVGLTEDARTTVQTGALVLNKMFVNANCEHPEAIVRMINLHCALSLTGNEEWYNQYETGLNGESYYKFLPWSGGHYMSTINDISYANDIRLSEDAGELVVTIPSTAPTVKLFYERDENSPWWYGAIGGHGGSYTYDWDMYVSGRIVPDAYSGLPTETMSMLGDVVNDALNTAMLEVIMGADISTYDTAVENWFANGGQAITDEVNVWYAAK